MSPKPPTDAGRRRLLQWGTTGIAVLAGGGLLGGLAFTGGGAALAATGSIRTPPGNADLEIFGIDGRDLGLHSEPRLVLSDAEWRRRLAPAAFAILRRGDTERAFSGDHERPSRPGIQRCAGCSTALFDVVTEFDSGTGWPSFWQPISPHNVIELRDTRFGMVRTEIRCARCEGHLGHVFDDGPAPTGLRYCMNSLALRFVPRTAT